MNFWVRLWLDMPTDPKWRVIAKRSNRPLSEVIAIFVMMMTNAGANAIERGVITNWSDEDVAAALDIETASVAAVREAMQGKTLDGDRITGWDKRQPKREDGSADRAKAWRERNRTQPNAEERPESEQKQKRTEKKEADASTVPNAVPPPYTPEFEELWKAYPPHNGEKRPGFKAYLQALKGVTHGRIIEGARGYAALVASEGRPDARRYTKHLSTWLNACGWETRYQPYATATGGTVVQPGAAFPATKRTYADAAAEAKQLIREGKL